MLSSKLELGEEGTTDQDARRLVAALKALAEALPYLVSEKLQAGSNLPAAIGKGHRSPRTRRVH